MIQSIRLWGGLEAELGADLEIALPGGLMVAEDERQLRILERKAAVERAHGLPVEILAAADRPPRSTGCSGSMSAAPSSPARRPRAG